MNITCALNNTFILISDTWEPSSDIFESLTEIGVMKDVNHFIKLAR